MTYIFGNEVKCWYCGKKYNDHSIEDLQKCILIKELTRKEK